MFSEVSVRRMIAKIFILAFEQTPKSKILNLHNLSCTICVEMIEIVD